MASKLISLATKSIISLDRLNSDWLNVIEDHLEYLKSKGEWQEVVARDAHEHHGNFYSYLQSIGYDARYHHFLLRVNDWHDPHEFTEETKYIMIVKPPVLDDLYNTFNNTFVNESTTSY